MKALTAVRYGVSIGTANGNGGSYNVSVDADTGEIVNMNQWEPTTTAPSRIPKYSRVEAQRVAEALAVKLQPAKIKETKLAENTPNGPYYDGYSDTYNFIYRRQIQGIASQFNMINVNVDKNTLKVRYFEVNWDKGTFPDASKAMPVESAKKIFEEKLGIELSYTLIYPPSGSGDPKPVLVYNLKNGSSPIDALTGEILMNNYGGPMYGAAEKTMNLTAQATGYTPQEQKVIDTTDKYITKEAAMTAISKYVAVDDTYVLTNSNLYGGYGNENAVWSFSWNLKDSKDKYGSINASVDAITGELKNFNFYNSDLDKQKDTDPTYTNAQAKVIADKYLQSIQPDKFTQTEYREYSYNYPIATRPNMYNFNYIRKANGIACPSNSLYVSVNSYTGQVIGYSLNWSNIQFPAATDVISLADAYKIAYAKGNFNEFYIKQYDYTKPVEQNVTHLAYMLENLNGMIDAKTGLMDRLCRKPHH